MRTHFTTKRALRQLEQAFTMVEVALALGVIAFAMVAIIGVLPTGLRVQKDNREKTTVHIDGTYFVEAIRSGARGLDDLTNYVDKVFVYVDQFKNGRTTTVTNEYNYTNALNRLTDGASIVGLLSTPKFLPYARNTLSTNRVAALVRSQAGNAAQRGVAARDLAFSYLMTCELQPYMAVSQPSTSFFKGNVPSFLVTNNFIASNNWRLAVNLATNLHELKLTFQWPIFLRGSGSNVQYVVGNNRKIYRTMISGHLISTNAPFYFFQRENYLPVTFVP